MNCKMVQMTPGKFSLFHVFSLNIQKEVVGIIITAIAWDVGELVVHCYAKD